MWKAPECVVAPRMETVTLKSVFLAVTLSVIAIGTEILKTGN